MDNKTINIHMQVTGPFPAQMAANGAAVQGFGTQANAGMAKATTGMARFGQVAQKVGTVSVLAVAAGLALSAKAAIDFETSFTGVRKTVETSESGFRMLADGVRQMSMEIPIGVNELNRIMELGGQLGVDPGGLLEFTDTIAKIGVTTTLTTETASMGFARLDNIMQLGGGSFDQMGAAVVDLGNNFAATEDEILTFALRIAPVGATVGATMDDVFAIATAFTSVGVPAERGGTAIQKTFIKIAEAVKMGGQELDVFARTAGMTQESFADMFEADPAAAFAAFIDGLGNIEESGGNVFSVLDSVDLSNQRVISSLLAMANAEGVLYDALGLSAEAYDENIALNEEAEKRFGTTASQMEILKNRMNDMAISVGTNLLPQLNSFIDGLDIVIDGINDIPTPAKNAAFAIGGIGAAAALAFSHPVIAGFALLATGIWAVGNNAKEAEQNILDMKEAGRSDEGYDSELGGNLIADYIGQGGVDELAEYGYGLDDLDKIIRGTNEDFNEFYADMRDRAGRLDMPQAVIALKRFRNEHREIVGEVRSEEERALMASEGALINQAYMNDERRKVEAELQSKYGEQNDEEGIGFILPAFLDDKTIDAVKSSLDDYSDTFTDAFMETDEALRGSIDLWYEWGDAITLNVDDLLASLARQITAVGDFETTMNSLDISQGAEAFIRSSFTDPATMEAFLTLMRESPEEFARFIRGIEREVGTGTSRLASIIDEVWEEQKPELEFTAGAELLGQLAAIAAEIDADPENIYDPIEVWRALMETAIDEAGPELAPKIIEMLKAAFGAGGIPGIDLTLEELEALIALLDAIPSVTNSDVNVTVRYNEEGKPLDPIYGADIDTPREPKKEDKYKARGGNVFAGNPYIVGEQGQELFVPFTHGTIVPNNQLGGMGNSTTVNVIRPETNDLAGDISEGLTRASITEQVDLIGVR